MTALLQDGVGPFTVADWHALPEREDGTRLELLEGHWLVSPPPGGPHQWAVTRLISKLTASIDGSDRTDLYTLGGIGVEISTRNRTALIPDFAVLNTPPTSPSFTPEDVVLAGEIWSPGNTFGEQQAKHAAYATAGVPFFWSITQDKQGPAELVAYRLKDGHYTAETMTDSMQGPVTITASPVPVELDVATLRP